MGVDEDAAFLELLHSIIPATTDEKQEEHQEQEDKEEEDEEGRGAQGS